MDILLIYAIFVKLISKNCNVDIFVINLKNLRGLPRG